MTIASYGKGYCMPHGTQFNFVPSGDGFELVDKPVAYSLRKKRNSLKHELAQQQSFKDWLTVVLSVTNEVAGDEIAHADSVLRREVGLRPHEWFAERKSQGNKDPSNTQQEYIRLNREYNVSGSLPASYSYENAAQRKFYTVGCERLLQWVTGEDADKWVLAMNLIAGRACPRRFSQQNTYKVKAELDTMTDYLQEITLHVYRDKAFDRVQLPDGVLPSRTNRRYFQAEALSQ
jgi:hypothetical protein